jgi:hypothetical protein
LSVLRYIFADVTTPEGDGEDDGDSYDKDDGAMDEDQCCTLSFEYTYIA